MAPLPSRMMIQPRPNRRRRVPLLLATMVSFFAAVEGSRAEEPTFYEGVTVSCQTWGIEWQSPAMESSLDELKALGVNAISIHPYARIENDGRLRWPGSDHDRHIRQPLRWARDRGISVMLIPHIAYWGTQWLWRGEIDFKTKAEWDAFFAEYRRWIVEMAVIAEEEKAPLFCVGLEYTHAQKFEEDWRAIIAAVRAVYHGRITYGANWNEFEQVPWWDAVDYLGVLAYFPLTKTKNPSQAELDRAWAERMEILRRFSKQQGNKKFVFVEIGYNENARAAAEPWSFKTGGPHAEEVQARCVEAALRTADRSRDVLAGMFWWKWFPQAPTAAEQNFRLQTPRLKEVLAKYWGERPAAGAGGGR